MYGGTALQVIGLAWDLLAVIPKAAEADLTSLGRNQRTLKKSDLSWTGAVSRMALLYGCRGCDGA
jgi:hypothetical protein